MAQAAASVRRVREAARRLTPGPSPADLAAHKERFFAALADDFNTPTALAEVFEWIREANRREPGTGDADLREMLQILALDNLLDAAGADGEPDAGRPRAARAARGRPRRARLRRGRSPARRAGRAGLAGPRLRRRARSSCAWIHERRARPLRAQPDPRGAAGGPAPGAPRVGHARGGRRAVAARRRGRSRRARQEIAARAGTEAHQGLCAEVGSYPYVDEAELLARPDPLIVVLDELQDPQNLGAICRTAECVGADGVVIPQRRSAEVTPAVCKASAGAVEHLPIARVRNVADFLAAAKEAGCWCYGAAAEDGEPYLQPDYSGGCVLVIGAEGRGLRPRVAAACDQLVALPLRGPRAVAQRERRRGRAAVRDLAEAQRRLTALHKSGISRLD